MLTVKALSFDYEDVPLLKKVNLTVKPGELLHLRGKNGVGKTTLLKLLAGLLPAKTGQIFYDGQRIQSCLMAYQQNLCYLGHKSGLSGLLSIRENYRFGLYQLKEKDEFDKDLHQGGLLSIAEKPCGQLSLGQRRRASLLRLWFTEAKLWLLDEPFASLDNEAVAVVMQKISDHLKRQGMVILTSHQDLISIDFDIQEYAL